MAVVQWVLIWQIRKIRGFTSYYINVTVKPTQKNNPKSNKIWLLYLIIWGIRCRSNSFSCLNVILIQERFRSIELAKFIFYWICMLQLPFPMDFANIICICTVCANNKYLFSSKLEFIWILCYCSENTNFDFII